MRRCIVVFSFVFVFISCKHRDDMAIFEFKADACFGTCPVFAMKIMGNGAASYQAEMNNSQQGKFRTIIRKEQLDSLKMLISRAGIYAQDMKYAVDYTDQPTYSLSIMYTDGRLVSVEDYGPAGPTQLKQLYEFVFSLRDSQSWK